MAQIASVSTNLSIGGSFISGLKEAGDAAGKFGSGFKTSMGAVQRAANDLKASIDPLWAAQKRHDDQLAIAQRLVARNAITLDDYSKRVVQLRGQLDEYNRSQTQITGTSNAQRAAVQNLGFQMQDFAVQVVGGTSVLRAFAQQAPQAAGAMSGLGGKLGVVGAFLNGPWGIALTLATTLLAGFADKLFASSEAGEAGKKGLDSYAQSVANLKEKADDATKALLNLNQTAGQKRVDDIGAARMGALEAEAKLSKLSRIPLSGTRAALQNAKSVRAQIAEQQNLMEDLRLKASLLEKTDARIRADEAKARAATQARADGAASRKAAAAARREETKAQREAREAAAREQARIIADGEHGLSDTITKAAPLAGPFMGDWGPAIDKARDATSEYWRDFNQKGEDRIDSLAETLEGAFSGAGGSFWRSFQSIGLRVAAQIAARLLTNNGGQGGGFGAILNASSGSVFGSLLGGSGLGGISFGSLFGKRSGGAMTGFGLGGDVDGLVGLARGGTIGGFSGIDRNLLSINGMPTAMVGRGEQLTISPGNDNGRGGDTYHITGNLMTPEFWAQIQAGDARAAAGGSDMAQRAMLRRSRSRIPG